MSTTDTETIEQLATKDYAFGFVTSIEADTFPPGHSEEIVTKALEGVSEKVYVFTKCERRWNEKGEIYKSLKSASIR